MPSDKLTIKVYNQNGEKVKDVTLNPAIFGLAVKESVVHQVAVAQKNNSREAIAHTKTRGEVRGGGIKPWNQKGTGRARHGSSRSPIWVGGGITFGPRNTRNFEQKVNKKMKRKALLMCLSDKAQNNLLTVVDKLELAEGRTRELVEMIKNLKDRLGLKLKSQKVKKSKSTETTEKVEAEKKSGKFDVKDFKMSLLVILPKSDKKIFNAGRNLVGLKIMTANSLNVLDLLRYEKMMVVEEGLEIIEKTYLK